MQRRSLAMKVRELPDLSRRITIVSMIVLAGMVSVASLSLSPLDAAVAAWWPAAGVSVIAVLMSRGSGVAAASGIAMITALGNVIGGRELVVAALFGVANAAEAWVVARLVRRGGVVSLETLRDVTRLLVAIVAGATVIGVLAGIVATVFRGQDLAMTFVSLLASHGSALLVIVPIALVTPRTERLARPWEIIGQFVVLLVLVATVFWPGNVWPLAFVPLTALLWAAFRLPTLIVTIELVVTAVAVTVLTAIGGGPFAVFADDGSRTTVVLIQLFLLVHASAALYVSAARNEWSAALAQAGARESALRELNEQKDDFISSVTHELRTPVTSILGFSEQLTDERLSKPATEAAGIIARNARRLADVIEDVLELSRLSSAGTVPVPPAEADVVALCTACAQDAEGLALHRGVRVRVRSAEQHIMLVTRPRELERVVANLLSNAVKFSPDEALIELDIAREGREVVITVRDQGPGIPPEYRLMVWERFARVPTATHRAVPGTGLGLAIVRSLTERRLRGSVGFVEGDFDTVGTTVKLRLPPLDRQGRSRAGVLP